MNDIESILDFIKASEGLKLTERSESYKSDGTKESVAEHSWRLALLASCLIPYYTNLDAAKVLTICLVHDLPEMITGDISASQVELHALKADAEKAAAEEVFSKLPSKSGIIEKLCFDYMNADSPEAKFVKALDKAETIIQHNQGNNPEDFN